MAAALAGFVLKQLASVAVDQGSLLLGLETEILKLKNTVLSIQAVLLDAEEQSGKNRQVQLWLRRLEEVLYDAEDLLDDFSTEVLRRNQMDGNGVANEVSLFFSPSNQLAYGREIANQIKAIRDKLDEIDRDRNQFYLETLHVPDDKAWRETDSSVPVVVVRREEDEQKIIDMLLLSSYKEKVAVVPIIGIGGLGKTTLAQLIYNDEVIKSHFACKVWVCVSDNFDPKLLVKTILESITKREVGDFTLSTLKDLLHEEIKNKQILLILDDVWNEDREKWGSFRDVFASGAAEGSRIIVTTRLQIVVEMAATDKIMRYELQGLPEDKSWSLFKKMAFEEGVVPDPRYVEIGKEVVRKCRGVPLAIRTMGGLLSFKETESEWEAIRDKQQLLGVDLPGGQEIDILEKTLKLSYDNLPSHLKRCFAYCSLFPKDHKIDVKMLVQLWMAQGYVTKSSPSSRLEDVGAEHFKNLLWRSFFQEVTMDRWGNMKYCKMHDLMHDLAAKVAGEEIMRLNPSNLTDDSLLNSGDAVKPERIRHLCIDFEHKGDINAWQVQRLLAKATRLRTFLLRNGPLLRGVEGRCEKIFPKMTRLRVLGLGRARKIESFSFIFKKMKHLRYLDLSWNDEMETLPKEITRMVNLQVLNLRWCGKLRLLPADIGKLSNLVYLGIEGCWSLTCIPAGIGNLSFLREFSLFIVKEAAAENSSSRPTAAAAGLGELKSLNNLSGELCIKGLGRVTDKSEAETADLKEKSQLQRLHLSWSYARERRSDHEQERSVLEALQPHPNLKELQLWGYGGTSIPTTSDWFSNLRNLVKINLYSCRELRSLPSLDPFVSLRELKLSGLHSLEYVQSPGTVASSSLSSSSSKIDLPFLPSLETLQILNCPKLIGWSPTNTQDDDEEESPLLPRVSILKISGCPKMVSFPRFRVNFVDVELSDVSSKVLSAFTASLVSPPHPPRFHQLRLSRVECDLPQGLMPQLTSLKILYLSDCDGLTTLSPSILRHLPSLQELHIHYCPILVLEDYDYSGNGDEGGTEDENNNQLPLPHVLPSLRLLEVGRVPKLVTLPKWLQHCSKLQQLEIRDCHNLKCLPSWFTKLTALEYLYVTKCDLLSGRCRSNTAEDWPIISHIPNIRIDKIDVQQGGRYLTMEQQRRQQERLLLMERQAELMRRQMQLIQQEASSHTQISRPTCRPLGNWFARMTCNLFQRCFLP